MLMRRIWPGLCALALAAGMLWSGPAAAQTCTSYPNPLTNGTTADASQVMANFNCSVLKGDARVGAHVLIDYGADGAWRWIGLSANNVLRWEFGADNAPESGSNAGSNFYLYAHADNGSAGANGSGYVLTINRASGLTSLQRDVNLGSAPGNVVTVTGHLAAAGATPSITACGASPAITAGGSMNDNRGFVQNGSGAVTSCTINFSRAWASIPACTVSLNGNGVTQGIMVQSVNTLGLTVQFTSSYNGAWIYICEG
jgi:hypothetical protein